jgi:hypothetical protein
LTVLPKAKLSAGPGEQNLIDSDGTSSSSRQRIKLSGV